MYFSGIVNNSTTFRSATLAGSAGVDGRCSGAQYSDPYGTWSNALAQAVIEIQLRTSSAAVKLNSGRITLPSGTTCDLLQTTCIDLEDGYTFWRPMPVDSCKLSQYSVLYEGDAVKTLENTQETAPVIYSLTTDDITFALTKTTEQSVCGYTLLRTEHPKLFIIETQPGNTFLHKANVPVDNLDIFAYVNSKFVYVEKHIRTQMNTLYQDIILQKCLLEQQVLKNALTIASVVPDELAYVITKAPGHIAINAGEVIHIVRCIPVEVKVRHTKVCYNELPVTHQNQSVFLIPKSRIITKFGTIKECNVILPVMYRIEVL